MKEISFNKMISRLENKKLNKMTYKVNENGVIYENYGAIQILNKTSNSIELEINGDKIKIDKNNIECIEHYPAGEVVVVNYKDGSDFMLQLY